MCNSIIKTNRERIETFKGIQSANFIDFFMTSLECGVKGFEDINTFIKGFGANFGNFTALELAEFTDSLATIGLSQDDIYAGIVDRMLEFKESDHSQSWQHKKAYIKLVENGIGLRLEDTDAFKKLVSPEYFKQFLGESSLEKMLADTHFSHKISLLNKILAAGLEDREDMQELTRNLVAAINSVDMKGTAKESYALLFGSMKFLDQRAKLKGDSSLMINSDKIDFEEKKNLPYPSNMNTKVTTLKEHLDKVMPDAEWQANTDVDTCGTHFYSKSK